MKIRIPEHFVRVLVDYYRITKNCRIAIAWDLYDVGLISYYFNNYYLWSKYSSGIFSLLHQPSDHLLGYVLIVNYQIIEFFTDLGDPLDWWNWISSSPMVRRPFYLDRSFFGCKGCRAGS